MRASPQPKTPAFAPKTGLRGRQKARRRQTILRSAEKLFARDGIEATTMVAIAEAAEVSPPTVFNHFGSKENILSALIFEGTEAARAGSLDAHQRTHCPFGDVIGALMCDLSDKTFAIAGKRIWRYAEAANIRRAGSDFQRRFDEVDRALRALIRSFLSGYRVALANGAEPDLTQLADLIFDRWNARYFEYIKDDAMPLATHHTQLRADAAALVDLVFAPDFAARSPLRQMEVPS